jgi:hypothetical protein
MAKRTNYYHGLAADFSPPARLDEAVARRQHLSFFRDMSAAAELLS